MRVYVDGGCSGNGQRDLSLRKMVAVVTDSDGNVLSERHESGGSNNIAELMAVRDALSWCWLNMHDSVTLEILTDSMNNLAWVNCRVGKIGKRINDRARVIALRADIDRYRESVRFTLRHVPREHNKAGHYIEATYSL